VLICYLLLSSWSAWWNLLPIFQLDSLASFCFESSLCILDANLKYIYIYMICKGMQSPLSSFLSRFLSCSSVIQPPLLLLRLVFSVWLLLRCLLCPWCSAYCAMSRPWHCCCQLLSCVWLFVTPSTAARQASLFFTISWSLLKLMCVESVMPSNHLVLSCPLLL